jgi:hypothetical protein
MQFTTGDIYGSDVMLRPLNNQLVYSIYYKGNENYSRLQFLDEDIDMYAMFVYDYFWEGRKTLDIWGSYWIEIPDPSNIVKNRLK